jgi:Tfp pilus assembly protein PilF
MSKYARTPRLVVALSLAVAAWCAQAQNAPAQPASAPQDAARPEVAKQISGAQELIKQGKHAEALAKLREADATPNLTPYEKFFIDRTRGAAALGAGDLPLAIQSLDSALASGRLAGDDLTNVLRALSDLNYRSKDYPKAIAAAQRYYKEGGKDPVVRTIMVNSLYLGGDYPAAARELAADVKAEEAAGQQPPEQQLRMLASAQAKVKDDAGYTATLERLVARFPKPELWNDLITRVQTEPGFDDRLRLDAYRLRLAAGAMASPAEYVEMAQLALQAGYPAEAAKAMDAGYAKGVLGTGPNAKAQQQVRDEAKRKAAADAPQLAQAAGSSSGREGNVLVNIGYALVTAGQADKGAALIEQGLAKGGVKHPEDAKLHLGIAQWMAGQKEAAAKTLKTVQGKDGTADLARLWTLLAQAPASAVAQQ